MAVRIRYKANGMKRSVADFVARKLVANGVATYADEAPAPQTYMTRQLVAAPQRHVLPPQQPEESTDAYDSMDADALRAIAADRGVKVHHKAGAEKLREALRSAEG